MGLQFLDHALYDESWTDFHPAVPSASFLVPMEAVTLSLSHSGLAVTQLYTISITAHGEGIESAIDVRVLVNGHISYLPLVKVTTID
jgi:hypothetical protein